MVQALGWKGLPGTNTLAYLAKFESYKDKQVLRVLGTKTYKTFWA